MNAHSFAVVAWNLAKTQNARGSCSSRKQCGLICASMLVNLAARMHETHLAGSAPGRFTNAPEPIGRRRDSNTRAIPEHSNAMMCGMACIIAASHPDPTTGQPKKKVGYGKDVCELGGGKSWNSVHNTVPHIVPAVQPRSRSYYTAVGPTIHAGLHDARRCVQVEVPDLFSEVVPCTYDIKG